MPRAIGETNHDYRIQRLILATAEDYFNDPAVLQSLSTPVIEELTNAHAYLIHVWGSSPYYPTMSAGEKARLQALRWSWGPTAALQTNYLQEYVPDWDNEVRAADSWECLNADDEARVEAGGSGCEVNWEPDCFYLATGNWADEPWRKAHYKAFKCEAWEVELAAAERRLGAATAAADDELGVVNIDPSTGLPISEAWEAAAEETETIIDSNRVKGPEGVGLGGIVPWLVVGGLLFAAFRSE